MQPTKATIGAVAGIALFVGSSYAWACFVTAQCPCAVAGSCYSRKLLPTCQIPTCVIADAAATTWNVCSGNGAYTGRTRSYPDSPCCPSACRVYDNCSQQYVAFTGTICCFDAANYQGVGSVCP